MGPSDEALQQQALPNVGLERAPRGLLEGVGDEEIVLALEGALEPKAPTPAAAARPVPTPEGDAQWYLALDGEQYGPVSGTRVQEMRLLGDINLSTLCWREGFDDWRPLWRVDELLSLAVEPELLPEEPPTPAPARSSPAPAVSVLAGEEITHLSGRAARLPEPDPAELLPPPEPVLAPERERPPDAVAVPHPHLVAHPGPPAAALAMLLGGGGAALPLAGLPGFLLAGQGHLGRRSQPAVPSARPALPVPTLRSAEGPPAVAKAPQRARPKTAAAAKKSEPTPAAPVASTGAEPALTKAEPAAVAEAAELTQKPRPAPEGPAPRAIEDEFDRAFGGSNEPAPATHVARAKAKVPATVYVPPPPGAGPGVPDALDSSDVMAGVVAHRSAIEACTQAQKKAEPGAGGTLVMRFTLLPGGKTADIAAVRSEGAGGKLAHCLEREIHTWTFPKHKVPMPVEFPFKY